MAGGAGVEYYFGYKLPQTDLACQDWRSRDRSWDACRIALDFFRENKLPFWEMHCTDALVGNAQNDNSRYCFAKPGEVCIVYLPNGGSTELNLETNSTSFRVRWFDPRKGGPLQSGTVHEVKGPGKVSIGQPPNDPGEDWVVLAR